MLELTGKRFHRLQVLGLASTESTRGPTKWSCRCDCGKLTTAITARLNSGHTKSCGCLRGEVGKRTLTTHGMSKSPEFKVWQGMRERCYEDNHKSYPDYGGRGILICDRWVGSFINFYADMGPRPEGFSIEREDNDGPYSPENCRWASKEDQMNNRRNSVMIVHQGETRTLSDWCKILELPYGLMHKRITTNGWSFEKAISQKSRKRDSNGELGYLGV